MQPEEYMKLIKYIINLSEFEATVNERNERTLLDLKPAATT
jgi:hypothetical protein